MPKRVSSPEYRPDSRPDRFDLAVLVAVVGLLIALAFTLLMGDRAGVAVLAFAPDSSATVSSPIRVRFSQPMNAQSVEAAFHIEPQIGGRFAWAGDQMRFTPERAWTPGTAYRVTIGAGAQAVSGRRLLADAVYTFTVQLPRVVYLAPAVPGNIAEPVNLWLIDLTGSPPTQLTHSAGIEAFRPAPDGSQIAYVQAGKQGSADLYLYDLVSGQSRRLTNCESVQARCQSPAWSPDGLRLAYERIELNPDLPDTDRDVPRTWLLSLRDLTTVPLLADTLRLGGVPLWSPDGQRIALYDPRQGAIAVYELSGGQSQQIPTLDNTGEYAFDPMGTRFVYPQLVMGQARFTTEVEMVDLSNPSGGIRRLSEADGAMVEDKQPIWHPDGKRLAITRRALDGSGPNSAQVYWMDAQTGKTAPLVVDERYFHGAIRFDPTGRWLLMQRLSLLEPQPTPGIWIHDLETGELRQIARNGYLPQWLP